jgi:hypothetical protein
MVNSPTGQCSEGCSLTLFRKRKWDFRFQFCMFSSWEILFILLKGVKNNNKNVAHLLCFEKRKWGSKGQWSDGSIVRKVRAKSNFERPRDYKYMYQYNIELHKTEIEMVDTFSRVIIHPSSCQLRLVHN